MSAIVEFDLMTLAAAEIVLLLLGIALLLYWHSRSLGRLVSGLERKLGVLRTTLTQVRHEADRRIIALQNDGQSYAAHLDDQLAATRNHHLALEPDRDIVLDLDSDAPPERRALALRHAFLIAEKEAMAAGDDKRVDWDVLTAKLEQLVAFYVELGAVNVALGAVSDTADSTDAPSDSQRWRELAAEQATIIADLQQQLENAETEQHRTAAIKALQAQLERQQRFLREADTCIAVLEAELAQALAHNRTADAG